MYFWTFEQLGLFGQRRVFHAVPPRPMADHPSATFSIALVSNWAASVNGRDYGSEDRLLAAQLRVRGIDVQLVLPESLFPLPTAHAGANADAARTATALLDTFDAILCRNNYGGVVLEKSYRAALDEFWREHPQRHKMFNDFGGCKGDYRGKQHLLDLYAAGFPVIPSTVDVRDLNTQAPFNVAGSSFIIKSMTGADSAGIKKHLTADRVRQEFASARHTHLDIGCGGCGSDSGVVRDTIAETDADSLIPDPLLQPMVDFSSEVSFVFFDNEFMYAMSSNGDGSCGGDGSSDSKPVLDAVLPDSSDAYKRWSLRVFEPTADDMMFSRKFVQWNGCKRQIQRVDACRVKPTDEGDVGQALLLMEIEDYNCWLSLEALQEQSPVLFERFLDRLAIALRKFVVQIADRTRC
jgi:hypothetical protein